MSSNEDIKDEKEDKKEDKVLNFHQMELDDRILKVNMNFNVLFHFQHAFLIGDSKIGMDSTDNHTGECDSFDS